MYYYYVLEVYSSSYLVYYDLIEPTPSSLLCSVVRTINSTHLLACFCMTVVAVANWSEEESI